MKLTYIFIGLLLLVGIAAAQSPVGTWVLPDSNIAVSVNADGSGTAMEMTGWIPLTDSFHWQDMGNNRFYAVDYWNHPIWATCDGNTIVPDGYPQYTLVRKN